MEALPLQPNVFLVWYMFFLILLTRSTEKNNKVRSFFYSRGTDIFVGEHRVSGASSTDTAFTCC